MKIGVLGSGAWGTALALELNEGGHEVVVWGHDPNRVREINQSRMNTRYLPDVLLPERIQFTSDSKKAIEATKFIVMATPSRALRETAAKLGDFSGTIVS